jgi:hypothetical protein
LHTGSPFGLLTFALNQPEEAIGNDEAALQKALGLEPAIMDYLYSTGGLLPEAKSLVRAQEGG